MDDTSPAIKDVAKQLRKFAAERDWEQFHTPKNVSMALSVEASELLEIFQWLTPEESQALSKAQMDRVKEEVGDVANYLIRLCDLLEVDLLECARDKIAINAQKYPAEQVRGKALKYDQLVDDPDA
jgi:dCTP diphosphatase